LLEAWVTAESGFPGTGRRVRFHTGDLEDRLTIDPRQNIRNGDSIYQVFRMNRRSPSATFSIPEIEFCRHNNAWTAVIWGLRRQSSCETRAPRTADCRCKGSNVMFVEGCLEQQSCLSIY